MSDSALVTLLLTFQVNDRRQRIHVVVCPRIIPGAATQHAVTQFARWLKLGSFVAREARAVCVWSTSARAQFRELP